MAVMATTEMTWFAEFHVGTVSLRLALVPCVASWFRGPVAIVLPVATYPPWILRVGMFRALRPQCLDSETDTCP